MNNYFKAPSKQQRKTMLTNNLVALAITNNQCLAIHSSDTQALSERIKKDFSYVNLWIGDGVVIINKEMGVKF